MKNTILIFSFFTLLPLFSWSSFCNDTDKGRNISVMGKVVYSVGDENCVGNSCFSQVGKEYDYCENEKVLIEYFCKANEMRRDKVTCPEKTKCHKGQCQR